MGPIGVLMEEENKPIVEWTLVMQECGLSITIQQLKLKVTKITQIIPTPFRDDVPRNSWLKWFQKRYPNIIIIQAKGLKVSKNKDSLLILVNHSTPTWQPFTNNTSISHTTFGTQTEQRLRQVGKHELRFWPRGVCKQFIVPYPSFKNG